MYVVRVVVTSIIVQKYSEYFVRSPGPQRFIILTQHNNRKFCEVFQTTEQWRPTLMSIVWRVDLKGKTG